MAGFINLLAKQAIISIKMGKMGINKSLFMHYQL